MGGVFMFVFIYFSVGLMMEGGVVDQGREGGEERKGKEGERVGCTCTY